MGDTAVVTLPDGRCLEASLWNDGERNRAPRFGQPCVCGCEDAKGIAYLTASNAEGHGFSLWLRTPADVADLVGLLDAHRLPGLPMPALEGAA